jgi:uncharacterized membrane protein
MGTSRLEAFTDGVLAIDITIMVLELKVPNSGDLSALAGSMPVLLAYVLSFVNIGHYWNNHHHLMNATERVDGWVLWANLFLLFWLSLVPFVIRWHDASGFSEGSTAAYGIVLGMASVAYELLTRAIVGADEPNSKVATAIKGSSKGFISIAFYVVAVAFAYVNRFVSVGIYVLVILLWLVPDRRMTRAASA